MALVKTDTVQKQIKKWDWHFPKRPVFFTTDIHGDVKALNRSLHHGRIGYGIVDEEAPELSHYGSSGTFIIGGDLIDKGPSSVKVLKAVNDLCIKNNVRVLMGNHDLRTIVGLEGLYSNNPLAKHSLVRLGSRLVELSIDVSGNLPYKVYQNGYRRASSDYESVFTIDEKWERDFRDSVRGALKSRVEKEIRKTRKKAHELRGAMLQQQMSYILLWKLLDQLYNFMYSLEFVKNIEVLYRAGSFLFVHAGLNDTAASYIAKHGVEGLNQYARRSLKTHPFHTYNGWIGDLTRTKNVGYKPSNYFSLTDKGTSLLHSIGIHGFLRGHQSNIKGPTVSATPHKEPLLEIGCDCCMNMNSRREEGVYTPGHSLVRLSNNKVCDALYASTEHFNCVYEALNFY